MTKLMAGKIRIKSSYSLSRMCLLKNFSSGDNSIMIRDIDGSLSGKGNVTLVPKDIYYTKNMACTNVAGTNMDSCPGYFAKVRTVCMYVSGMYKKYQYDTSFSSTYGQCQMIHQQLSLLILRNRKCHLSHPIT